MPKGKKKRGKKKKGMAPLVIAAIALGAGIFFLTRKASAAPALGPGKKKMGPGKQPPPNAPPSARPAPEMTVAPDPIPTGDVIDDAPAPWTGTLPPSWKWSYIGAVDPNEAWSVGQLLTPEQLPFGAQALIDVSPFSTVEAAYYLAEVEILAPGYYVVGQINQEGFGFEVPFWGIIQVWQD
jgi:hypothetical protein